MEKNARFNVWVNGGVVTLTLRPGQRLRWFRSQRDEEGYSFDEREWELLDGTVYHETVSGGRDCDGLVSHTRELECPLADLHARRPEWHEWKETSDGWDRVPVVADYTMPEWVESRPGVVYDEYAQAAGY